jgi:hypothetical protein
MDKPIPLAASEIRLLKAARKLIEGGEPLIKPYIELEAHDISLSTALDACEKYFHGSKVAFRIAFIGGCGKPMDRMHSGPHLICVKSDTRTGVRKSLAGGS